MGYFLHYFKDSVSTAIMELKNELHQFTTILYFLVYYNILETQ